MRGFLHLRRQARDAVRDRASASAAWSRARSRFRCGLRGISHVLSCGCTELDRRHRLRGVADSRRRVRRAALGRDGWLRAARHDLRLLADARGLDALQRAAGHRVAARSTAAATASCSAKAPGCSSLEREDRALARGVARLRAHRGLRLDVRRVSPRADGSRRRRNRPLHRDGARRARSAAGRDRLHQLPRHLDAAERRHRVEMRAARVRRACRSRSRLVHQVDDRPSAGRQRRAPASPPPRWRCSDGILPPTINLDEPGSRRATWTSSRTRRARADIDAGALQLPRLRIEEQRARCSDGFEGTRGRVGRGRTPVPDVLVVGAGPAGSVAALVLARAGVRVRLVDRARFPRDKLCGDTLNPGTLSLLDRLGIAGPLRHRATAITGMDISGSARRARLRPATPKASAARR